MRITYLLMFLSMLFFAPLSQAGDDIFGDDDETIFSQSSSESSSETARNSLSSFLESRLPSAVLRNIKKKEKVFCYIVDYTTPGYDGYVVNDLAVKGSCGELSAEGEKLISDVVLNNNSLYSASADKCSIVPKIMLRYINGIDHTDILFSSPCPSITFFHGRDIITINAGPGKDIIEKIVNAYMELNEKFLSPALLGQLVGNGQIITQDQKEIVRRLSPTEAPLKQWKTEQDKSETQNTKPTAKPSGWNKFK